MCISFQIALLIVSVFLIIDMHFNFYQNRTAQSFTVRRSRNLPLALQSRSKKKDKSHCMALHLYSILLLYRIIFFVLYLIVGLSSNDRFSAERINVLMPGRGSVFVYLAIGTWREPGNREGIWGR